MRRGVFPGSFDPLTKAHVAIAEAAIDTCALDRLELVMSTVALAKAGAHSSLEDRIMAIERHATRIPQLRTRVTEVQLLVDIAEGYDVLVIGADKWLQLHDVAFYGSAEARDAALVRLPELAVAPRAGVAVPRAEPGVVLLELGSEVQDVSSTAVRAGRTEWRA